MNGVTSAGNLAQPAGPVRRLQTRPACAHAAGAARRWLWSVRITKLRMTDPSAPRQPSHNPANTSGCPSARAIAWGFCPRRHLPFIERVRRDKAASSPAIGVTEHGRRRNGLGACVYRACERSSGPSPSAGSTPSAADRGRRSPLSGWRRTTGASRVGAIFQVGAQLGVAPSVWNRATIASAGRKAA